MRNPEGRSDDPIASLEAALAEAEALFAMTLNIGPGLAVVTEIVTAEILLVGDSWCDVMGWAREELIGRPFTDLNAWVNPEERVAFFKRLLSHGKVIDAPLRFRTKDGRILDSLSSAVLFERDGRRYAYSVGQNITERLRMERQVRDLASDLEFRVQKRTAELSAEIARRQAVETALVRAKEEAEVANRAKSAFLSSMSHELRTPLNAILGFAQLLSIQDSHFLETRRDEYVGHILAAGEHLLGLINDVLDLSRIEAGRVSLTIEPLDPAEVLGHVRTLLQPVADGTGVSIASVKIPPGSARVRADRGRLDQVLLNLGGNAVKYNRPGGEVTLAFGRSTTIGYGRFSVTDTGFGIPADRLGDLFQPFSRIGDDTHSIEGTGIGLTIARQLVEMMDGHMGVDTREGVGSCFWFELPLES